MAGTLPREVRAKLKALLAMRETTFTDWLRQMAEQEITAQGEPDGQGQFPAMVGTSPERATPWSASPRRRTAAPER
jgi:hypothetical protein